VAWLALGSDLGDVWWYLGQSEQFFSNAGLHQLPHTCGNGRLEHSRDVLSPVILPLMKSPTFPDLLFKNKCFKNDNKIRQTFIVKNIEGNICNHSVSSAFVHESSLLQGVISTHITGDFNREECIENKMCIHDFPTAPLTTTFIR